MKVPKLSRNSWQSASTLFVLKITSTVTYCRR